MRADEKSALKPTKSKTRNQPTPGIYRVLFCKGNAEKNGVNERCWFSFMDMMLMISRFVDYCHSKQLRPKTLTSYEQTLKLFARWLEEAEHITTSNMDRSYFPEYRDLFIIMLMLDAGTRLRQNGFWRQMGCGGVFWNALACMSLKPQPVILRRGYTPSGRRVGTSVRRRFC